MDVSRASILAAVKENYQVSVDLSAVGVANQKKFQNTETVARLRESSFDSFMGILI